MLVLPILMPPMLLATMPRILTTMAQTLMVMMVMMMDMGAGIHTMNLRDPLRGRAFRCNLRFAPISAAIPVASARKLAARSACRRARHAVQTVRSSRPATAESSSRRRCAPRSSRSSPRSPWPAAPAPGFASARRRCPSRVAGAGFAAHRAAHRAVHWCGHSCRRCRLRLRQRASHDCLRLRPHRPPLNRHGGSPPPASPASIPPSLSLGFVAVSTPCGVWFSHPTHQ